MIFNWISRCWGGMGINTQFQKARLNCTIADWTVPFQDDVLVLITSFQDKNPQIAAKTAINNFLSHLQTDEQKNHPAFLLKHLYVLDHCIQQMTALDTIGYYYNSNLTATKSHKNIQLNENRSPLRQLINTYYAYLITKARTFGHYESTYFSKELRPQSVRLMEEAGHNLMRKKTSDQLMFPQSSQLSPHNNHLQFSNHNSCRNKNQRQCTYQQRCFFKQFQKQSSYNSIFDVIQKCQQLQKLISSMNKAYISGNRKVQLIRYIFIMCLWTYIRCYIIVSVGIRFLFKHFITMSLKQLERFVRVFGYYNNQYTGEFIRFVQSNKTDIDVFREINYNQLTYVNKDGMRILVEYKDEVKTREEMKINTSKKLIESYRKSNTAIASANNINNNNNSTSSTALYPVIADQMQEMIIIQLPHEVQLKIKENMKIFYKPRKNMDYCLQQHEKKKINDPYFYSDQFEEDNMTKQFFNYDNFYHENFSTDVEEIPLQLKSNKSQPTNSAVKMTPSLLKINSQQSPIRPIDQSPINILNDTYIMINEPSDSINQEKTPRKKSLHFIEDPMYKITTEEILDSHQLNRSMLPIKPAEMHQIKEMFQHKRKPSRKYSNWEEWENVYQTGDGITMKN